jgi:ComF family protein
MHLCGGCLKNPPFFKAARSVFFYEGPVREALIRFKFEENIALSKFWVREILLHLGQFLQKIKPEVILPVPLHIKRLRQRGYNQSLLIAKDLAIRLGIRCEPQVLRKVKFTPPQVGLSAAERKRNVRGSFTVENKEKIKDKCVLLIDDVFTTGSTVNECARVLIQAGAKAVFVITLARTTDAMI